MAQMVSVSTGKQLGLGLAALGRPGYINLGHRDDLRADYSIEAMQQRAHAVMDVAWEQGIRYFDAARSYGRAEQFLTTWLEARGVSPSDVVVASKWGYTYTADWRVNVPTGESHEVKQHSLERLDAQWAETQALLGERLDLYQIHSATLESGVLSNAEVLARLVQLREQGTRIGLSVSGANQADVIRTALGREHGGRQIFSAVQATWNLLEPSAGDALQEASDAGWAVIVKEGVANGRLTDRNRDAAFASVKTRLQAIADQHDVTIDAIALSAVLQQPWSNVVLSGAATAEQLISNAKALQLVQKLDEDQMRQLVADVKELPAAYWQARASLAWN